MTVDKMREALIGKYGAKIRGQLITDMPDCQVIAIHRSLAARGDLAPKRPGIPKRSRIHEPMRWEQMRMDI